MIGLIKDIGITLFIIILSHFVYAVEGNIAYDFVIEIINRNHTLFLSTGILGSAFLLIFTAIEGLGLYKITYGLSKIFVRLSQFFITFLALLNIVFYVAMSANLMRDSGYFLLFVLMLILSSSCWALRIIDFNYHTRNALVPVGILSLLSVLLVEYIWPLTGF